jgi:hypothetical protein
MHWWISRYDDEAIIFNASGKFGQYVFVDRANDIIFTRITKYQPGDGSIQDWGFLKYINWIGNVNFRIALAEFLDSIGVIDLRGNIKTPVTLTNGTSKEFYANYTDIMDALVEISR